MVEWIPNNFLCLKMSNIKNCRSVLTTTATVTANNDSSSSGGDGGSSSGSRSSSSGSSCSSSSSPTSKTLPAMGVRCGLRTSNSLLPQTTVLMVCPCFHHFATRVSKCYMIATSPQSHGVVGAVEGKP